MRSARWLAALALAVGSGAAAAHSAVPGIGHFYNGVLHPLLSAAQLEGVLAFGLLLGQRGLTRGWPALAALFAALAAGLLFSGIGVDLDTDAALLALAAAIGLGVVCALGVPPWAMVAVAALLGVLVGLGTGPLALTGSARWASLFGSLLGAGFAATFVAQAVEASTKPFMRIGVRVVGSWVTAAALLVLTLSLAGPHR